MLSQRTLGFLEGLANSSNVIYPEGGLQFTFNFAYGQAHKFSISTNLAEKDIQELGRLFQGSLGQYTKETSSQDTQKLAKSLVERLRHDLQYDTASLVIEDEDYGMAAKLKMVQHASNCVYSLELWWSVD